MSVFYPTLEKSRITQIDKPLLDRLGVTALMLDIDNTLTTHNNPDIAPDILAWIGGIQQQGIRLVILSNNYKKRVTRFAQNIPLAFESNGMKPLGFGFRRAHKKLGVPKSQIAVVGDQIFTDILGGNLYGIKTIRVTPIETENTAFFSIKRRLESYVIKRYYAKQGKKQ